MLNKLNKELSMDLLTQLGEELFWKDMEKSDKYLESNSKIKKIEENIEFSLEKIEKLELREEIKKEFFKLDEVYFDRQSDVFDYVLWKAIALGYSMATFEKTLKDFLE